MKLRTACKKGANFDWLDWLCVAHTVFVEVMDRDFWECLSWQGTGIFAGSKLPQIQPTVAINTPLPVLPDLPPEALENNNDDTVSITSAPNTPVPMPSATEKKPFRDPVPLSQAEIAQKAAQLMLSTQIESHKALIWSQLQDTMLISELHASDQALNAPFKSIEDAWAKLHLYHVYSQPATTAGQQSQCKPRSLAKVSFVVTVFGVCS
jgi:hypothetical protein